MGGSVIFEKGSSTSGLIAPRCGHPIGVRGSQLTKWRQFLLLQFGEDSQAQPSWLGFKLVRE